MTQQDFELEAKDAAKAMLKKKAPTRPETFERPRKTGKRRKPKGKRKEHEFHELNEFINIRNYDREKRMEATARCGDLPNE